MINEENLLKVLKLPHISEKSSILSEKNNTIVIRVNINATKIEIKTAINKIFKTKINNIRTLIIKGKTKRHGKRIGYRKDYKKSYISLKKGQTIDFISNMD